MILIDLLCRNFMSFGDEEQTVSLHNEGLVFVTGENRDDPVEDSNGSGKSAILEAIVWCLFGKTLRGLKGDEVINEIVGKDCVVSIRGRGTNGEDWEVARHRKLQGKSGLEFTFDGRDLTAQGDTKDTQRSINQILDIDYDVFVNAMVFGQGDKWRFTELTDATRKELLDRILGIEHLHAAKRSAATRKMELLAEASNLEHSAKMLDVQSVGIKNQVKATVKSIRDTQAAKIEALKAEWQRLSDVPSTDRERSKITKLKAKLGQRKDLEVKIIAGENALKKKAADADKRADALWIKIQDLRKQADLGRSNRSNATCDACGCDINPEDLVEHIADLDARARELENEHGAMMSKIDSFLKRAESLSLRLVRVGGSIRELWVSIGSHEELLKVAQSARDRKRTIKRELVAARSKRRGAKSHPDVRALVETQDKLNIQAKQVRKDAKRLDELAGMYGFWEHGFGQSGIKSHYLDHVVPVMNERAGKFSEHIMGGKTVEFRSQTKLKNKKYSDKLDIIVRNENGADSYSGSSTGEKRKVDIVIARTLQSIQGDRKVGGAINVAFWDEVFESLDESSCEVVIQMLQEESKTRSTVFVVSHLGWLEDQFPKVINVVKEGGFSRIE